MTDEAANGFLQGRHLLEFDCVRCGHVDHRESRGNGSALQIGECLLCWQCVCALIFSADADGCPVCWPSICPADGNLAWNHEEHEAHVAAFHAS